MGKNKLITSINAMLPSVEGEDERLVTAAKLRSVLLSVYNAGIADALQTLVDKGIIKVKEA